MYFHQLKNHESVHSTIICLFIALERAYSICRQADVIAALTLEVLKGSTNAFDRGRLSNTIHVIYIYILIKSQVIQLVDLNQKYISVISMIKT